MLVMLEVHVLVDLLVQSRMYRYQADIRSAGLHAATKKDCRWEIPLAPCQIAKTAILPNNRRGVAAGSGRITAYLANRRLLKKAESYHLCTSHALGRVLGRHTCA